MMRNSQITVIFSSDSSSVCLFFLLKSFATSSVLCTTLDSANLWIRHSRGRGKIGHVCQGEMDGLKIVNSDYENQCMHLRAMGNQQYYVYLTVSVFWGCEGY